jgi:hypothetical protein
MTTEERIQAMTDEDLVETMKEYAEEKAMPLYQVRIMLKEAANRIENLNERIRFEQEGEREPD